MCTPKTLNPRDFDDVIRSARNVPELCISKQHPDDEFKAQMGSGGNWQRLETRNRPFALGGPVLGRSATTIAP